MAAHRRCGDAHAAIHRWEGDNIYDYLASLYLIAIHYYRQVPAENYCYEVFGFDVLLTKDFKPFLLEVEALSSFFSFFYYFLSSFFFSIFEINLILRVLYFMTIIVLI